MPFCSRRYTIIQRKKAYLSGSSQTSKGLFSEAFDVKTKETEGELCEDVWRSVPAAVDIDGRV